VSRSLWLSVLELVSPLVLAQELSSQLESLLVQALRSVSQLQMVLVKEEW
jgi:hypothetical protein